MAAISELITSTGMVLDISAFLDEETSVFDSYAKASEASRSKRERAAASHPIFITPLRGKIPGGSSRAFFFGPFFEGEGGGLGWDGGEVGGGKVGERAWICMGLF